MSEVTVQGRRGVAEVLPMMLCIRAIESQRPDALIDDEKAVTLIHQMEQDSFQSKMAKTPDETRVAMVLCDRDFERHAQDFQARHPQSIVVHIGCGPDTRFDRVGNGQAECYDLDASNTIRLGRKLLCDEGGAITFWAAWRSKMNGWRRCGCILTVPSCVWPKQSSSTSRKCKSWVLALRDNLPGAELVFDGWKPFEIWAGNLHLPRSDSAGLLRWGFWRGQKLEGWGDGIRLLDGWSSFDQPEPRRDSSHWMAPIFRLFRPIRIFHFQLWKRDMVTA